MACGSRTRALRYAVTLFHDNQIVEGDAVYQVGRMGCGNNLPGLRPQLLLPLREKFYKGFQ
jgi:hypothetical protein